LGGGAYSASEHWSKVASRRHARDDRTHAPEIRRLSLGRLRHASSARASPAAAVHSCYRRCDWCGSRVLIPGPGESSLLQISTTEAHPRLGAGCPAVEKKEAMISALSRTDRPAPRVGDHRERNPSNTTHSTRESFHDRVADQAFSDGNRSSDFRAAARAKATAFTIWLGIAVVVWVTIGFGWALIPAGLASFKAIQCISATQVARAMESRHNERESTGDPAQAHHFDLEDPADIQRIDQIREAFSELLVHDGSEYPRGLAGPGSGRIRSPGSSASATHPRTWGSGTFGR